MTDCNYQLHSTQGFYRISKLSEIQLIVGGGKSAVFEIFFRSPESESTCIEAKGPSAGFTVSPFVFSYFTHSLSKEKNKKKRLHGC